MASRSRFNPSLMTSPIASPAWETDSCRQEKSQTEYKTELIIHYRPPSILIPLQQISTPPNSLSTVTSCGTLIFTANKILIFRNSGKRIYTSHARRICVRSAHTINRSAVGIIRTSGSCTCTRCACAHVRTAKHHMRAHPAPPTHGGVVYIRTWRAVLV